MRGVVLSPEYQRLQAAKYIVWRKGVMHANDAPTRWQRIRAWLNSEAF